MPLLVKISLCGKLTVDSNYDLSELRKTKVGVVSSSPLVPVILLEAVLIRSKFSNFTA
jgi:hypothetical protein